MHTDAHRWEDEAASINQLTEAIIGAAMKVQNTLGCGFLEKVYENALAHELRKMGFEVKQQEPVSVLYDGVVVGEYVADLLVAGRVLVETKAVRSIDDVHKAQALNYLKATGLLACLLLNFGTPRLQIKRLLN